MDLQVCPWLPASTATRRCCHELTSRRVCRRGAPRRWYDNGGSSLSATSTARLFGVRRALTRFGVVTAEAHSASCPAAGSSAGANCAEAVQLSLSVEVMGGPPDQPVDVPTPLNESRLRIATVIVAVVRLLCVYNHSVIFSLKILNLYWDSLPF